MNPRVLATALFLPANLLACGLLASAESTAPHSAWYNRALVGMEVGPTGAQFGHSDLQDARYCARFDGREIVRRCTAARCDYLVLWARDGDFAYYSSKLLPIAPGLGERDPLREAVEEARARHCPVIAYCVVQQGGHFLAQHPEFEMRDPEGRRLGRFCLNSGYLNVMKQIVAEQLAYGIDGFHIDMLDQGFGPPYGCWCNTCRRQFEAEFHCSPPRGATWDEAWQRFLEFRYRSSERFERALCAHIKSINPRASVDFNYHGNPPFSWEVGQRPVQHAGNGDFNTGETGVWGFSALGVGLNAEFYRAATPDRRFQVAMQRGVRMYHDQTTRPLADLRWELLTLLAHGAVVTVVDKTGLEGSLDAVAYQRIGEAFADAQARREHFVGGHRPVADVGIWFSSRTRDWFGRDKPAAYFQAFQGLHKALVYEHIPWGIVLDENAKLDMLQTFPVIALPNAAILSDSEVTLLQTYVEAGGNLLMTGLTGSQDQRGQWRPENTWEKLVGGRLVRQLASLDNWARFADPGTDESGAAAEARFGALRGEIPAGWPFLVKGPAVVWQPTTATPVGQLLAPQRTVRQQQGREGTDWPMSPDSPVGPAMLVQRIGQGTVVTFAASPDSATASEHYTVEARRWLTNAVRFLRPNPRVCITAPVNVEAVVTEEVAQRTLRVHLLCYQSPPQATPPQNRPYVVPALLEDRPLFRARLQLAGPIREVRSLNRSTILERQERVITVTVNDVHDVIVVKQ